MVEMIDDNPGGPGIDVPSAVQFRHDWRAGCPVAATLTRAVVAVKDDPIEEVDPLYTSVDPEALEALFQADGRDGETWGQLSFVHDGCYVELHSDGTVSATRVPGE